MRQLMQLILYAAWTVRDLAPPGELTTQQLYQAEFANVEMQYDSHRGIQVRLRCARQHTELGSALLPEYLYQ